jgi:hypothetical protein
MRGLTVARQEHAQSTHRAIDNNADNNPLRHRQTQDDNAYFKMQQNSALEDVYEHQWTERGELHNRRALVRFLSHLPRKS